MEEVFQIVLTTETVDDARVLLEEYGAEAIDRLRDSPACEQGYYIVDGNGPYRDGGAGILMLRGNPEAVAESERDRWEELISSGLVTEWEVNHSTKPPETQFGEEGATLLFQLGALATEMSAVSVSELDGAPEPVPISQDAPVGSEAVGWGMLLHMLSNHQGMGLDAEKTAYVNGLKNCLWHQVNAHGVEVAESEARDLADMFDSLSNTLSKEASE